jgi:leader peptidase (prepilin peptidase)/N-methyltransferase
MLRELPILDSIFGIILGGGILLLIAYIYKALKKRDGMGMGDVKLLAMIGAFFGWEGVLFVIFLGSILGSVIGISIIVARRGDLKYALPFGPFLSIAAVVYIFTGGFKIFLN